MGRAWSGLQRIKEFISSLNESHSPAPNRWLQGEFVHVNDYILHDADMDQRAPIHELMRAHLQSWGWSSGRELNGLAGVESTPRLDPFRVSRPCVRATTRAH